jgi:hypothetical protein
MKKTPFWDIELCSLVEVDTRFRGGYSLYHQTPLKRRSASTIIYGATRISQKDVVFIVTVVRI